MAGKTERLGPGDWSVCYGEVPPKQEELFPREDDGANPKTLMGRLKVPMFSVIPPAAIAYFGVAMRYGAYEAPRKDGSFGYGPYNWRDQPVEASTYVDATIRHIMQFWDGENDDPGSKVPHLAAAIASLGILIDAIENGVCKDDRPKNKCGAVSKVIDRNTRKI